MDNKYAVNQRVRDLMKALGFQKVDPFYKKYFGADAKSERLRTVFKDETVIKTEFLVEITEKIVEIDGKKPNGHWLLTGEGDMFIVSDTQVKEDTTEKRELIEAYRRHIESADATNEWHKQQNGQLFQRTIDLEKQIKERDDEIKRLNYELTECYKKRISKVQ